MKSLMAALFSLLLLAIASSAGAKTTNDGTATLLLNGTGAAADATWAKHHRYCPLTCFCDFDSSIVSCAGTEEEPIDVILGLNRSLFNNNTTSIIETVVPPAIPNDVWSVIAAADIQRLDVRDLLLQRLDSHLILNGTERLVELSLVRCGLASIANDTFAHHSNLERLDLSQNQLTILSQVHTISR